MSAQINLILNCVTETKVIFIFFKLGKIDFELREVLPKFVRLLYKDNANNH